MLSHAPKFCTNIIPQLQNSNTMYGLNFPVLVLLFQAPPHLFDPSPVGWQWCKNITSLQPAPSSSANNKFEEYSALLGMTCDAQRSHGGQTNVQRTSNEGQTEVKQMLDEKARWQNSMYDDKAQDVRTARRMTQDNRAQDDKA